MKASSLSTAITRIKRSPYQAIAAISVMTLTLFLAGVFIIIAAGSHAIIRFFESQPQVIGYYKSSITPPESEVDALISKIKSLSFVKSVQYTSKEEALKNYTQANLNSPLLLQGVTSNVLPASIEVSATDPKYLKQIADELAKDASISEVQFPEDIVAPFTLWTRSIRIVGIALVGVHVLVTFLVILLIMSVKVVSRKDEIVTFKLLGATNWYISWPFVLEGFIYGLSGAILAWGTAYLVLLYSMGFLVTFLAGTPILPPPLWFMFSVLGLEVLLGALIGGMGGLVATSRFLKK
jgi:cell division transport system permease protein